jgi:hypothetical protein
MSIASTFFKSVASGTPIAQALATAASQTETWLGQIGQKLVQAAQSDPAVHAAVTNLTTDGKVILTVGAQWANTAIAGGLGEFATELEALVAKYAPIVAGASRGPLTAAALTGIQALGQVGVAVVNSTLAEVAASASPAA